MDDSQDDSPDQGMEEGEIGEEEGLQIAEECFAVIAEAMLKQNTCVSKCFHDYIVKEILESENNEEYEVELISPVGFLECLSGGLGLTELTEKQVHCLMLILVKPELENAILVLDLMMVMENFGIVEEEGQGEQDGDDEPAHPQMTKSEKSKTPTKSERSGRSGKSESPQPQNKSHSKISDRNASNDSKRSKKSEHSSNSRKAEKATAKEEKPYVDNSTSQKKRSRPESASHKKKKNLKLDLLDDFSLSVILKLMQYCQQSQIDARSLFKEHIFEQLVKSKTK